MLVVSALSSAPTYSGHIATLPETLQFPDFLEFSKAPPFRMASKALSPLQPQHLPVMGRHVPYISVLENHLPNTPRSWMPTSVHLHPLDPLPRIPSLAKVSFYFQLLLKGRGL